METKKSPVSRIAELREQAGLTQKELSKLVGVTENTIANWEKGRSGIDLIEKLIRLCKALDCDLESLIDYNPPEKEPSFAELRAMYKKGLLNSEAASNNNSK